MNFVDSWASRIFGSESLKIYLQTLLLLGFLEVIIGRGLLHAPQLSDILLPFTLSIINFETIIEVPILISFTYLFWKNRGSYAAAVLFILSSILLGMMILLYYFSLANIQSPGFLWAFFLFLSLTAILAASSRRIFNNLKERKPSTFILTVFLVLESLTYFCIYIYFASFSFTTYFGIEMPETITLFSLAQNLIPIDALVLFFYALFAPCKNLNLNKRLLLKILFLPSLVVALLLIAQVVMPTASRFNMQEIIALVLSMWGFAIRKGQIFLYTIMFWFFLVATMLLKERGQKSGYTLYTQEYVASFLIFFAGFLNTLPYLLMSVIANLLFAGKIE